MKQHFHYATVTEAIEDLRTQGFTEDFSLQENYLTLEGERFEADEFDILEVFRYEGDSDPGDEATVYGIQSSSGIKGVLVTGYGMSSDEIASGLLQKLHNLKQS